MPSEASLMSVEDSALMRQKNLGEAPKAIPEDTSELGEDGMPLNPGGDHGVQFIPNDPANGDAKVELGNSIGAPTFVGLGKEELMKYANDPFWVRLRWALFFLFWLVWLAMLAGAIFIIVMAPKCPKKAEGETIYQMSPEKFSLDGKLH